MAILKVARLGHPVLRRPAREVTSEEIRGAAMRQLVSDMQQTMEDYGGVGLAAPQVHCPLRVAIVEFSADNPRFDIEEKQQPTTFFNPRVRVLDATPAGFWEGCLSVPGLRGYVQRPSRICVDYLDDQAVPRTIEASGFLATVLQHEFDHLDGVLYVDRLADPSKFAFIEEFERHHSDQG